MLERESINIAIDAIRQEKLNRRKIPEQVNKMLPEIDIDETRLLGAQHLAECHEDFERAGWCEV